MAAHTKRREMAWLKKRKAPAAAEQPAEEAPADSGNGDPMDTQEMEVGTSSEGNAHQDHASSDASKACEEPSKPSGGAAVDQPSSGSKAKEEDSSTTFECPEPACGGKIVMNDDLREDTAPIQMVQRALHIYSHQRVAGAPFLVLPGRQFSRLLRRRVAVRATCGNIASRGSS
eukprot:2470614-Rhodomonas_salina.1